MKLIQNDPSYIRIEDISDNEENALRNVLTYKDLNAQFTYLKAKNNKFAYRRDPYWQERVNELKSKIVQCALLEDKTGLYTYSGLIGMLKREDFQFEYVNNVIYPKYKAIPYALNYKPYKPHKHQEEAVVALLEQSHAALQIATGGGKSFCIENLIKNIGLPTLIMVPSVSIASQFYEQLIKAFGKKYIGLFGDGKKEYQKHIVVGIAASLTRIAEGTDEFKGLSQKQLYITDETHQIAAKTLSSVALGLAKNIPYRYFVSATPERGDGKDTFLEGLIGPIVYQKNFRELVIAGVLADLHFSIFNVESEGSYVGNNSKLNSQDHCLYNSNILSMAARIASLKVSHLNEQVLVLVEEKEQAQLLQQRLTVAHDFAHSGSDIVKQVDAFNAGKTRLLIGTSAIATGTDIRPVTTMILLLSGKSTVKFMQAVGRCTRKVPGKEFCQVIDFHVVNDEQSSRHFKQRLELYSRMSDHISFKEME